MIDLLRNRRSIRSYTDRAIKGGNSALDSH